MHELAIATSILKTAEEEVRKAKGRSVRSIHLEIGKLSGVEPDSLRFIWLPVTKNTVLEQAELIIQEPAGRAKCLECGTEYAVLHHFDNCPTCNGPFKQLISGKAFKIKKLIIH